MNKKTRALVLTAVLIAITLIFGLSPLGFIPIVPGFIEITIMCIPVIVGALTLGLKPGISLGAIFAITSVISAFTRSPLGAMLLEESVLKTLILLVVPRLLVPVAAFFAEKQLSKHTNDTLTIGLASAVGSAINTALFLVLLRVMFANLVAGEVFTFAAFVNGITEAIVAVVVCIPVIKAVRKSVPNLDKNIA